MHKFRHVLVLSTLLFTQAAFADTAAEGSANSSADQPCATVAKACLTAGFERNESPGKEFWQDCMKPILVGQTPNGVTVDAKLVKTCRATKVKELKSELRDLQKASAKFH